MPKRKNGGAAVDRPPPSELDRTNVLGFFALLATADVELDALTLLEGLEALALDGREVHEHIIALFPGDEAIALLLIEKLHSALCHRIHVLMVHRVGPIDAASAVGSVRHESTVGGTEPSSAVSASPGARYGPPDPIRLADP